MCLTVERGSFDKYQNLITKSTDIVSRKDFLQLASSGSVLLGQAKESVSKREGRGSRKSRHLSANGGPVCALPTQFIIAY